MNLKGKATGINQSMGFMTNAGIEEDIKKGEAMLHPDNPQIATVKKNIEELRKKKRENLDRDKLRRTVIHGLPCDFVKFNIVDNKCKDVTLKYI